MKMNKFKKDNELKQKNRYCALNTTTILYFGVLY